MHTDSDAQDLLLPKMARLFYIGPPKTGTTTLQSAAAQSRDELYASGVYYPGTKRAQGQEVMGLMGKQDWLTKVDRQSRQPGATRTQASRVPPRSAWDRLMADVEAEPSRRVLLGHESAASASPDMARRFVQELGYDRTHIAITLRPLVTMLPSRWSQFLKYGLSESFEHWLKRVYGWSDQPVSASVQRYLNQADLVERWASIVGPENVTVVIVDKHDKDILTRAFEQMLGLPSKLLSSAIGNGVSTNRSMSRPEAELLRGLNAAVYDSDKTSWSTYLDVVKSGAIDRVLSKRVPEAEEPRLKLPPWAAELALRDGEEYADRISRSGVRIAGDIDALRGTAPTKQDPADIEDSIPMSVAMETLTGAFQGAVKHEKDAVKQVRDATKLLEDERASHEETRKRLTEQTGNYSRTGLPHHAAAPADTEDSPDDTSGRASGPNPATNVAVNSLTTSQLLGILGARMKKRLRSMVSRRLC